MYLAKRILAFLLCLIMIISVFGCTQPTDTSTKDSSETTQSENGSDGTTAETFNDSEADQSDDSEENDPEQSEEAVDESDDGEKDTDKSTEKGNSENETSKNTSTSTESVLPKPTEPSKIPDGYVAVAEHGYPYYRIVYEAGLTPIVKKKIQTAVSTFDSKLSVTIELVDDETLPTPTPGIPEILIGKTNRSESRALSLSLRSGEYKTVYDEATGNILLAGGSASSLGTLIDTFFKKNLNTLDRYFAIPKDYKLEKLLDFPIQSVTINGVALQEYVIVHSSTADTVTKYAALNLADYIENNMGVKLEIVTDKTAEQKYEILIGSTKRAASKLSTTIGTGKYVLVQKDEKIVMQGKGIYVGAAVGAFVSKLPSTGNKKVITINDLPTEVKAQTFKFPTTHKNAIILIGDGMGFNHIEMAKNGGMTEFYAEQFPNKGEAVTRSMSVIKGDVGYTDSAAAATALATGYKTYNGRVGMDADKNSRQNIRELAHSKGAKTAVVTTDVIGGATPGGFLAHNLQRKVNDVTNPDIIAEIDKLITNKKVDYTMGRSADSADATNPDILTGTREALAIIASGGEQFFLMVEGAYIDKDSHNNRYDKCVAAVKQYNEVIAYLSTFIFCHPTTSLVVTADHETGSLTKTTDTKTYKYGYKYTSGSSSYRQHTNNNVPVFAIGPGTEYFNGYAVENVCIPHFSARAFGSTTFGDSKYYNNKTKL